MSDLTSPPTAPSFRRNAAWNCAGVLCDVLVGFLLMPLIVRTLGETNYGLWALIGSMTGCFGFLDLGVRGALGRQLAFHRARHDRESMSATLSTGMGILIGAAAVTLLAVLLMELIFFHLFDVPPEQERIVRLSLLLAGCNLAMMFPLSAFDASLWAAQRFDRLAQIDSLVSMGKAAAICLLLRSSNGLLLLPVVAGTGALLAGGAKIVMTWRAFPGIRVGWRHVGKGAFREIFSFGAWNFAGNIGLQLVARVPAMVIGAVLSPAAVTPYAIAERLVNYANVFVVAATGILTPRCAAYAATGDTHGLTALFLKAGRLNVMIAALLTGGMCLFSHPFLLLWMGKSQSEAWPIVAILAIGGLLPTSQLVTGNILTGMARHHILTLITLGQGVCVVLGCYLSARLFEEPLAVSAAYAVVFFLAGAARLVYGCRTLGVGLWRYLRDVLAPGLASPLPALAVSLWAGSVIAPSSLAMLCLAGTIYLAAYLPSLLLLGGYAFIFKPSVAASD